MNTKIPDINLESYIIGLIFMFIKLIFNLISYIRVARSFIASVLLNKQYKRDHNG